MTWQKNFSCRWCFKLCFCYYNSMCVEEVYELMEYMDKTNTTEHDIIPPKILKVGSDKLGFLHTLKCHLSRSVYFLYRHLSSIYWWTVTLYTVTLFLRLIPSLPVPYPSVVFHRIDIHGLMSFRCSLCEINTILSYHSHQQCSTSFHHTW